MNDLQRLIQASEVRANAAARGARSLIDLLAKAAFEKVWRTLVDNPDADPRAVIQAAQLEFGGGFSEALAEAFSLLLQRSIGTDELRAMPVGDITLARSLYLHRVQTQAEVTALVREHAKGVHQARELSLALYDGYSPEDGIRRPLEGRARAELPRALRSLTEDATARRTLTALQVQGQQQAARLKTRALRAAYLETFEAWERGANMDAVKRKLDNAMREKNRYYADRIAQTELQRAHQAQIAREVMDDELTTVVQVRIDPSHPRADICDLHARADLWGLGPGNYPKEKAPRPPYHPFCLPASAKVSTGDRIAAVTRRWYDGDMVVITTASGKRLEATVNHPVLTSRGWVAAGLIDVGGDVVSRAGPERVEPGHIHDEHVPTRIAEVFDSFGLAREVATVEVPTAAPDFHGDGMAGQVAVVRADRELWDGLNSSLLQSLEDRSLVSRLQPSALLGQPGIVEAPLDGSLRAADCIVSSSGEGLPVLRGQALHPDDLLLARGAQFDAGPEQAPVDDVAADAELARQILDGSTGPVLLDKVLNVHRYAVACHVYNLETTSGHYTADGIVTHNCRCRLRTRPSLDARNATRAPSGEAAYLRQLSEGEAAAVMGSAERARRIMQGEALETVVNEGKAPAHRLMRVGDLAAQGHPLLKDPAEV